MEDVVTSPERRGKYQAAGHWDDTTLAAAVWSHAASHGERVAVIDDEGRGVHTYDDIVAAASRVARHLLDAGTSRGDVVSIQLPNHVGAVIAALAAHRIGAVLNPILPNYRRNELEHIWRTSAPTAIFTPAVYRGFDHRVLVDEVRAATGQRPHHVIAGGEGGDARLDQVIAAGQPLEDEHPMPAAAAVSEIIFTSGTEATPKAIMHSEQTANFSMRVARDDLGVVDSDVVWMPSPVGHSTGFNYGIRFALYHGLTLVLQDVWDPRTAVELIGRYSCSYTLAATTFLKELAEEARRSGTTLSSMRLFGCGGAPVPAELVALADEVGIVVLRLYGSTEGLVVTWNRADSAPHARQYTDGRAMTNVEVVVVDERGTSLKTGQPGEILVRGPNTCLGFFNDPDRTAATFTEDGWVRSGDLGILDDEGYLSIVGRKKEIIIRGGLNIAPREIEDLMTRFPEVDSVAVVGLPDERLGERMCACVVLRAGHSLDLNTVTERLRETGLAVFKLPERLEVLDAFPMTPSGKVQKHVIVDRLRPRLTT